MLNVPRYDFNWQLGYDLKEPMHIPKGTKLVVIGHYDNSLNNPRNPAHPPVEVKYGEQTTNDSGGNHPIGNSEPGNIALREGDNVKRNCSGQQAERKYDQHWVNRVSQQFRFAFHVHFSCYSDAQL